MEHIETLSEAFASMLPAMGITLVACIAWFAFCRWFYRAEEANWQARVSSTPRDAALSLDDRMTLLSAQSTIARRGSPADRLFFAGLMVASVIVGVVLMGHMLLR